MHFSHQFDSALDFAFVRAVLRERQFDPIGPTQFRRSTRLRTMIAFDPSRWQVEVEVAPDYRQIDMIVATDGQLITPRERAYFRTLFAELIDEVSTHRGTELALHEPNSLSQHAAEAALNENVAVTFGFFMSLPIQVGIFHFVLSFPMIWSIVWGTIGSLAIAYAVIFSFKNRAHQPSRK